LPIPDADAFGTIRGKVYFRDCQTPVYGVQIYGKFYKTIAYLTDSNGNQVFPSAATVYQDGSYQIGLIPPGNYQLRFRVQDLSGISRFGDQMFSPATSFVPITITRTNTEGFKITDIPDVCLDNLPPHLISLVPSKTVVSPNETITITATAQDPDNDILYYYWSASDGFLGLGFSNSITWTAPSTPGTYKIKVVLNDHKGGWDSGVVEINVGMVWWAKSYGGSNTELGYDVIPTSDGGFIVVGGTESYLPIWVLKLNKYGEIIWEKAYGFEKPPRWGGAGESIIQTGDGGFIVAGYIYSPPTYEEGDLIVMKLDSEGRIEWGKTYDSSYHDFFFAIHETLDGGFILLGRYYNVGGTPQGTWVLKLNKTGDVEWAKGYPEVRGWSGGKIIPLSDGTFLLVVGFRDGFIGWIANLTNTGDIIWQKGYYLEGYRSTGDLTHVIKIKEGGYVVAGNSFPYGSPPPFKIWIWRLSENGEVIWGKGYQRGHSIGNIKEIPSGNLITTGATDDFFLFVLNLNPDGSIFWQKAYGPIAGVSIEPLPENGYIVAGLTSFGAGNGDFWVLKLLPDGTCPPLGVDYNFIVGDFHPLIKDTDVMPTSITHIVNDIIFNVQDTHAVVMQQAP